MKKSEKEDKKPHEYTFAEVLTWGVSTEYFVIVVGTQDSQHKIYLETSQVYKQIPFHLFIKYFNINFREEPLTSSCKPIQIYPLENRSNN